jgi:hypothetical protein
MNKSLQIKFNSGVQEVTESNWTESETQLAQKAFKIANERETRTLIQYACQKASEIKELDELWQLHDFLSSKRHEIEGKYDNRVSMLVFVFAQLLKEGWLNPDDLAGLGSDKLTKITALAKML